MTQGVFICTKYSSSDKRAEITAVRIPCRRQLRRQDSFARIQYCLWFRHFVRYNCLLNALYALTVRCFVIADLEHKDDSLQTQYDAETLEEQNAHFPSSCHPALVNTAVVSTGNTENVTSTSSTEAYQEKMDRHLGRCIERHQSLLK